jgi:hypothetical protein
MVPDYEEFWIGGVWRVTATFRNAAGVATDTTAVLTVFKPDATTAVLSTTNTPGTGIYVADVPITQSGDWYVHSVGTGAVADAEWSYAYARRDPRP